MEDREENSSSFRNELGKTKMELAAWTEKQKRAAEKAEREHLIFTPATNLLNKLREVMLDGI